MSGFSKRLRSVICVVIITCFLYSCGGAKDHNRLSEASSPYLLQHADNPVNWYEWGEEAINKAKKENKPLLISIGYASCHWCHVMERESFMDTAVARVMNESFINIKVDREERPDIDNIYMNACQLLTGSGGWPLNAFALPDGKPFFAGTYYPKESWINLIQQIAEAYTKKNDLVQKQATALTNGISETDLIFPGKDSLLSISRQVYQNLFDSVYQKLDLRNGELAGTPKFPLPAQNEWLLQYHYLTGNQKALDAATLTLTRMALGGMYDQVGGGFARYSTDSLWRVPHFEKMLYDNGQLLSVYAHAYQVTRNEFFKTILDETVEFASRELTSPEGGYYSSINAESDGIEGKYYTWSYDEFTTTLGEPSAKVLAEYYTVVPGGNQGKNENLLLASHTVVDFARLKGESPAGFMEKIKRAKTALLTQRNKRNKPSTDTKILTAWNAIMIHGLCDAYAATGNESYLQKALTNARFLEKNMVKTDGHLYRNFMNGKASVDGFLDDYAWLAKAYIRLYQVTFDIHWLQLARQLTGYSIQHFYDINTGMFFYTSAQNSNLVVRKIEITDNAIPSSCAIMAGVLFELGIYFDDAGYSAKSHHMITNMSEKMKTMPEFYTYWSQLAGLYIHGTFEVAIMGPDAGIKNRTLQQNYLPTCIFMGATQDENLPLLEGKLPVGKTLIYVCTNKTCKLPVEETGRALKQIIARQE